VRHAPAARLTERPSAVPIYDYACSNCGHLTEVVHGIQDSGPKFCPNCGSEGTMTKAFSTPAIHFKGSGWAKKDRSTSSRAAAAKKDESTTTTPTTKPSGGDSASSSTGDAGTSTSGGSAAPAASSGD
jgi:putative FmdB family regulatory protein